MAIQLTGGATLGIVQGAPATYDQTGFDALSFQNVGEIESFGEFGNTATITEFTAVDDRIVNKLVGSMNPGDLALTLGRDATDAGQVIFSNAVRPAHASYGQTFSIKITYDDASVQYFTSVIGSYTTNPSDVNSVVRSTVTLGINNEIIEV